MTDKQPEALRLAEELERKALRYSFAVGTTEIDAADELRRLHALCEEMGEALGMCLHAVELAGWEGDMCADKARAALAKWKESK